MNFGARDFVKSTYEVAKILVKEENSFLLSGAHEYDGTAWFNKERLESTLWYALAANAMLTSRVLRDQIYCLYRTLKAAKDKSEYKCLNFTNAVRPVENTTAEKKPSQTKKKTLAKKDESEKKTAVPKKTAAKENSVSKEKAASKKETAAPKKAEAKKKVYTKKTEK